MTEIRKEDLGESGKKAIGRLRELIAQLEGRNGQEADGSVLHEEPIDIQDGEILLPKIVPLSISVRTNEQGVIEETISDLNNVRPIIGAVTAPSEPVRSFDLPPVDTKINLLPFYRYPSNITAIAADRRRKLVQKPKAA